MRHVHVMKLLLMILKPAIATFAKTFPITVLMLELPSLLGFSIPSFYEHSSSTFIP